MVCNTSDVDLTNLEDGNQTINVWVNDTVNIWGLNNSYVVQADTSSPTVSLSLSSAGSTSLAITISKSDGTCTSNRGTVSGATLTDTGLTCGIAYSYTVTCTDSAGNSGSATQSFETSGCGGAGDGTTPPKTIHSWTKITPGAATIMKDFDSEIGVKQIQIEVNNEAQNVEITVTKYSGKPAAVSIAKSGKIHQYLQIDTKNLEDKLKKAIVNFRAEKTWMTSNNVVKENVDVYKFNEGSSVWDELESTYVEEDNNYYYYDVELTSFSYFAIAEKAAEGEGEEGTGDGTTPSDEEKKNLTWLWILIILIIVVVVGLGIRKGKKKY